MSVSSCKPPTSRLLNPAVRGMTEWKAAFSTFAPTPIGPKVAGLFHSIARIARKPDTSKATVPVTVILVCRDQRRQRR